MPKILFIDLEMCPMEGFFWQPYGDRYIAPARIKHHTSLLAWAAKWRGKKKIYYEDQSKAKNVRNDKKIATSLHKMILQADIVVAHCLKRFDSPKSEYRFIVHGLMPTQYEQHDTYLMAKKFGFDYRSLDHLAFILKCKSRKYAHAKFPGDSLFDQCTLGNKEAWKEMKKYNPQDIVVLEEVYEKLLRYQTQINFSSYEGINTCTCGCKVFRKDGFRFTKVGKYQKYRCNDCGKPQKSTINLHSKEKKLELRHGG